ncbi:CDP-glucose 4,6-dehydratase [Desulfocucumis palustris]|nr:CDP-glucose 4,6-dehydratase [Desulfocucumis palustris]
MKFSFWNGRRVLITGHTGFKGSWLSLWLHKLNAEVIGYSLSPPTKPSLYDLAKVGKKVVSIHGDVRDRDSLLATIQKYRPEVIFHMAAQSLVKKSFLDPVGTFETNIMGTVNLLEAVRHVDSARVVVNVTSDKCYANREWVWGYRENDPMGGVDPYSSSKGCSELITSAFRESYFNTGYCGQRKVAVASVRAGNVIGGGDWAEDRLIPDCIRAIMNNKPIYIRYPDAVRPWQHVLEPLFGYLLLARRLHEDGPNSSGGWNFGPNDSDSKTVRWMVNHIVNIWGGNARWEIDQGNKVYEANYLKLDCSKARSILGWYPQWNLTQSLVNTIKWYKSYFGNEDMLESTLNQIDSYQVTLGHNVG